MQGENTDVVKLGGNTNKAENSGFEQLERQMSIGIANKLGGKFHYDELLHFDENDNITRSKIKAVKDDNGRIDIGRTFQRIRDIKATSRGGC